MYLFFGYYLFIVSQLADTSVDKDDWEIKFKVLSGTDFETVDPVYIIYHIEPDLTRDQACFRVKVHAKTRGKNETYRVQVPKRCRNVTAIRLTQDNCGGDLGGLGWLKFRNLATSKQYYEKCNVNSLFNEKCCPTCIPGWKFQPLYLWRSISCKDDYFGVRSCDRKCHCLHNAECTEYNGWCPGPCVSGYLKKDCQTVCPINKYGMNCQQTCGKCAGRHCDPATGFCQDGCQIGHIGKRCQPCPDSKYGINCTKHCHCFGNYACDTISGSCGRFGCALSWHGHYACDQRSTCKGGFYGKACVRCGHCKKGFCNVFTGHCPRSKCQPNFFGSRCDTCAPERYGLLCNRLCGHCLGGKPCNSFTGACPQNQCAFGYSGTKCDMECEKGYFGANCIFHCVNCVDEDCLADTGKCNQGCLPGLGGEWCNASNIPQDCKLGYYPFDCSKLCGHCAKTKSCNVNPGSCPTICKNNYNGHVCKTCPDGFFGVKCSEICGNCKDGNICEPNGKCTNGCLNQFVGPYCFACASGYFGPQCDESCGHCRFKESCDSHSGACPNGCADGFTGHFCRRRLSQDPTSGKF